jgi:bifunctional UDP-N-acetylglucosamine pyrophosphorylase/glucosamine-1-phosphate N-acetyltransferase
MAGSSATSARRVQRIVEHKDASAAELKPSAEVNTGVMLCPSSAATRRLARRSLGNDNAQGEYYLTDVIATGGRRRRRPSPPPPRRTIRRRGHAGINDRLQLAEAGARPCSAAA